MHVERKLIDFQTIWVLLVLPTREEECQLVNFAIGTFDVNQQCYFIQ